MKKLMLVLSLFLFPGVLMAGVETYRVNGEVRLYDTGCYANTPNKKVLAEGGGYYYEVPTPREECRVRGEFARVDVYKYDFVSREFIFFKGTEWLEPAKALRRKNKIDAGYHNSFSMVPPTQRVEIVKRLF